MKRIAERLKERLDNMTEEEKAQEWEELKKYNEIGPTVDEYLSYWRNIMKNKGNENLI